MLKGLAKTLLRQGFGALGKGGLRNGLVSGRQAIPLRSRQKDGEHRTFP